MTCRSFGKSRSIKIEIDKPVLRKNGSIKYNYGSLAHSITVPNSFMQRIEAYDKAQYEPNSLFNSNGNHGVVGVVIVLIVLNLQT
jgi:hypothetical protein